MFISRFLLIYIIPLFVYFVSFCDQEGPRTIDPTTGPDPVTEGYWIPFNGHVDYVQRKMIEAIQGEHVIVYIAEDLEWDESKILDVSSVLLNTVDNYIYPTLTSLFNKPSDVNGDKKISLVVTRLPVYSNGLVLGMFNAINQFLPEANTSTEYSNYAEIIYIDDNAGLSDAGNPFYANGDLIAAISHEFYHLLSFSGKVMNNPNITSDTTVDEALNYWEELWLDEGFAQLAPELVCELTDFCTYKPWDQIQYFNEVTDVPLIFNSFEEVQEVTDDYSMDVIAKTYSQVYIYARYIADHLGGRSNNYNDLANLTTSFISGIENINNLIAETSSVDLNNFSDTYIGFIAAILSEHSDSILPLPFSFITDLSDELQVYINLDLQSVISSSFHFIEIDPLNSFFIDENLHLANQILLGMDINMLNNTPVILRNAGDSYTWEGSGYASLLNIPTPQGYYRGGRFNDDAKGVRHPLCVTYSFFG